jgi:hypothetical protein
LRWINIAPAISYSSSPARANELAIELTSADKREFFMLDVTRAQIKLTKATFQNRVRQAIVLMRLDIDGPPHRNPDGEEIACPHLHVYREGFGVKWAHPLLVERYPDTANLFAAFESFMRDCNVATPPNFAVGLF